MSEEETKPDRTILGRFGKTAGALVQVHLDVASREAKGDFGRIIGALIAIVFAFILGLFALLVLNCALVVWAHDRLGRGWLPALMSVGASELVVAMAWFAVARSRLRRPVLAETRGLLRRTAKAFTD